jgi:hypothetical protein
MTPPSSRGDLAEARHWADDSVAATAERPCHAALALTTRARVAIADGQPDEAEDFAHEALARAAAVNSYLGVPDLLECLAGLAGGAGSYREAARLYGASDAIRQRIGVVRFKIYDSDYAASAASVREALGEAPASDRRVGGPR